MQHPRWGTSKVVGVGDKRLSRAIHDLEDFWKIMAEGGFLDFFVVQLLSRVPLFATSRTVACQASLSFTICQSLLKLMSTESVAHLTLCFPLFLPSIFPSIRVFFSESTLHVRWPKYWSFSISPCNKYSGLIPFRIDWFDLLAVQGTLKSLLQHDSLKTSILQC